MYPIIARTFNRLHERLLGRATFSALKRLRRSEYRDRLATEGLQLARLRRLVAAAYEHIPYWRGIMDRQGFAPADIRSLGDLRRFPLLDKQAVREHLDEMVWRKGERGTKLVRTSGSTNAALEFYTSRNREAEISAARMRGHSWIGIDPGDKEVYFWAAPVELGTQDRIKNIRDYLRNDGFSSALNLSPEVVEQYVASWKKWGANCLFGYVSSFSLLVRFAEQSGLDLRTLRSRGLRAVVTTSELLSDEDRRLISQAFGVPVYDSYGLREIGLIGHECREFTLHTNDEQLILETVDRQTLEPTDGEGELVATSLISTSMPFIRYRTGDVVTLSRAPCPCGRTLGHVRVTGGRVLEFVVTSDRRWISAVAFIYICRQIKEALQIQVRQDRLGEVRVLVVPGPNFTDETEARVREAVRARIGGQDAIVIERVASIPPSPSGKQRLVISKVAEQLAALGRNAPPANLTADHELDRNARGPDLLVHPH
jgi:phenylacetate-CoA ligase